MNSVNYSLKMSYSQLESRSLKDVGSSKKIMIQSIPLIGCLVAKERLEDSEVTIAVTQLIENLWWDLKKAVVAHKPKNVNELEAFELSKILGQELSKILYITTEHLCQAMFHI